MLFDLKKVHPKARHYVVAKRFLNEQRQIVEYSSDDGEPKGSSGVPVLNVMRGNDLIESAIIVVRYFGGTKLGVGGLVRAYTKAAKMAIGAAVLSEYKEQLAYTFSTDYRAQREVRYHLDRIGIEEVEVAYRSDKVEWKIMSDMQNIEALKRVLQSIPSCCMRVDSP